MENSSVNKKLGLVFLSFFILAFTSFFIIRSYADTQRTDGAIIDAAGRNRMLSQRLGFYAEQIVRGNIPAKEVLNSTIQLHHVSFYALKDGGIAPEIADNRVLPPTIPSIMPIVETAEKLWLAYKTNSEIILNEPIFIDDIPNPVVGNALTFIEKNAPEILRRNNEMVKAYVRMNGEKQVQMNLVLFILLFVNVAVVGLGTCITILITKKTETLAKDLEKFKMAVDNTSDSIVIADPEGIMIYGNKSIERTTGYKPEEAVGKKAGALWKTPMSLAYFQNMWNTIKKQKKTFIGEIQNKRKNGEVYTALISISPIIDKSGDIIYFVGIERDVTKEREVDREKTEFISLASHQLRTPLSAMKWYGEMLLDGDGGKLNREQKDFVENIYHANERMIALVNILLNISRIESGRLIINSHPVELVGIVKGVREEVDPLAEKKHISMSFEISKGLPKIRTDGKILHHILLNLITNSIKYSKANGSIHVVLSQKEGDILTYVRDTGVGIAKEEQGKVFQKFFRGKNVIKMETDGTGLGLYLVKYLVETLGGKIWFESEENRGTAFFYTLPVEGTKSRRGEVALDFYTNLGK